MKEPGKREKERQWQRRKSKSKGRKKIEIKEGKTTRREETRAVSEKSVNFYIISDRIYRIH